MGEAGYGGHGWCVLNRVVDYRELVLGGGEEEVVGGKAEPSLHGLHGGEGVVGGEHVDLVAGEGVGWVPRPCDGILYRVRGLGGCVAEHLVGPHGDRDVRSGGVPGV